MTGQIILFELRYWLRQPLPWIFLGLAFAFASAVAVFEGGAQGSEGMVHVNAPAKVYELYADLAFLWLPVVAAFVNATAIRDFAHRTADIVFSTVVTRRQYLIGRWTGSTLAALLPTLGLSLGLVAGSWMPYGDPIRFGPNNWAVHGQAFLWFAVTGIVFQSAVMFAVAALVRSTAAAFVTSVTLIVLNMIAMAYSTEVDNAWLASLLDPFGSRALDEVTRYWSVNDMNTRLLPAGGPLLGNRLLWLGIAVLVFAFGYVRFSFTERRQAPRSLKLMPERATDIELKRVRLEHGPAAGWRQHLQIVRSDLHALFRSPVFWIIMGLGLLMVAVVLSEVTQAFGNRSWPVTGNVVEVLRGLSSVFVIVIITYYAGELVWRDRDTGADELMHTLPVRSHVPVIAHLTTLVIVGGLVHALIAVVGMVIQLEKGWTRIEPGLYLAGFIGPGLVLFAFWSMIALTVQLLVHHKYAGFAFFIVLFAVNLLIWRFVKVESNLVVLYGSPRLLHSDMNGFGPFLMPWLFFRAYWLAFAGVLLFVGALFMVRGAESGRRWRMGAAARRMRGAWGAGAVLVALWLGLLGLGVYNTRVLNRVFTDQDTEALQADYERTYKPLAAMALPHITAVDLTIVLDPGARAIAYSAKMELANKGDRPVDTLWFSLPDEMRLHFRIPNAIDLPVDSARFVRMFRLSTPIPPGGSIVMNVGGSYREKGFRNDVEFLQLVENGTFLSTTDLLPGIGYQPEVEITDPGARRKRGLPPNRRMEPLSDDPGARRSNMVMRYTDHIRFSCTIGTAIDQVAIAPGTLRMQWEAGGRRWFRYASEAPIFNFWAVLSARYQVAEERAGDVRLQVYHDPQHALNVPRMLKAMRDAISFASERFGPYQHTVARIIEFPRYRRFAQSFPGTMPYSEAIGFITDLRDTTAIDMVYYVVAHEVAHQWWGHQVLGPRMQGTSMMNESMAQYTALRVMEREYGRGAMRKFLKYERDNYLRGRRSEGIEELPLMKVEDQQYIHYSKGSVVMYMLKELIGADRVDSAYREFISTFAFKDAPYPTTLDLYRALERVTPDSLRYLLTDGLEKISFYRNAVTQARGLRNANGTFTVEAIITCSKVHADGHGNETAVPMNDWLDVAVQLEGGEVKQRLRLRSGENRVRIIAPFEPRSVIIDPDHLFFDREEEDDVRRVEVE